MIEAYIVEAARPGDEDGKARQRYVAMSHTPDEAVALVGALVAAGTVLTAAGDTLAPAVAAALRLQPGMAKLV